MYTYIYTYLYIYRVNPLNPNPFVSVKANSRNGRQPGQRTGLKRGNV